MKIQTETLGETIAVIQIRYNFSIKELAEIWNIHPTTLSAKIRSNKFNAVERMDILDWLRKRGFE